MQQHRPQILDDERASVTLYLADHALQLISVLLLSKPTRGSDRTRLEAADKLFEKLRGYCWNVAVGTVQCLCTWLVVSAGLVPAPTNEPFDQ